MQLLRALLLENGHPYAWHELPMDGISAATCRTAKTTWDRPSWPSICLARAAHGWHLRSNLQDSQNYMGQTKLHTPWVNMHRKVSLLGTQQRQRI